jgi:hypothetical protein
LGGTYSRESLTVECSSLLSSSRSKFATIDPPSIQSTGIGYRYSVASLLHDNFRKSPVVLNGILDTVQEISLSGLMYFMPYEPFCAPKKTQTSFVAPPLCDKSSCLSQCCSCQLDKLFYRGIFGKLLIWKNNALFRKGNKCSKHYMQLTDGDLRGRVAGSDANVLWHLKLPFCRLIFDGTCMVSKLLIVCRFMHIETYTLTLRMLSHSRLFCLSSLPS